MGYSNDGSGLVEVHPRGARSSFTMWAPGGSVLVFFFKFGKKDKSGSFRNMHILDVLVLLGFFFSNVLFGIFVRLHPQQLEVSHVFFKCDFASDEWANTIGMPVFLETSDDAGSLRRETVILRDQQLSQVVYEILIYRSQLVFDLQIPINFYRSQLGSVWDSTSQVVQISINSMIPFRLNFKITFMEMHEKIFRITTLIEEKTSGFLTMWNAGCKIKRTWSFDLVIK